MEIFTAVHVFLSLVGIGSGLVILRGMLGGRHLPRSAFVYLASTMATSVTGFFFPYHGFTPGLGVGVISLVVLSVAIFALYQRRLAGAWRSTYVVTSTLALYLNVFVLIAQLFQKVPVLKTLASNQGDPSFIVAQSIAVVVFLGAGLFSVMHFRSQPVRAGSQP